VLPPSHLAERMAEERAAFERRKKEREEAHLYMEVAVASDNNFRAYQGFDIVPWKSDAEEAASPKVHRILRTTTMAEFAKMVGDDIGVDADMLRPWSMVNRQNGTVRPDTVLEFPDMTLEEAASKHGTKQTQFRLWVETAVKRDESGAPVFGDKLVDLKGQQSNRPLMIFLKQFDAKTQSLFGAGTFYAALQDKVQDLSPAITKMLGWQAGTQIKLSEEIKQNMIEAMKPRLHWLPQRYKMETSSLSSGFCPTRKSVRSRRLEVVSRPRSSTTICCTESLSSSCLGLPTRKTHLSR
jgi:ubiquitin carboxyl-terminal hydrolase 7